MDKELRTIYDTFLDSGELDIIMPEATGIWEQDKTLFSNIYLKLDESTLDDNFEDDDFELDEEDYLHLRDDF